MNYLNNGICVKVARIKGVFGEETEINIKEKKSEESYGLVNYRTAWRVRPNRFSAYSVSLFLFFQVIYHCGINPILFQLLQWRGHVTLFPRGNYLLVIFGRDFEFWRYVSHNVFRFTQSRWKVQNFFFRKQNFLFLV